MRSRQQLKTFVLWMLAVMCVCTPAFADQSVARRWNELLLESIRRDLGRPTIHARNLFHESAAMYDAWAVYDDVATPWLVQEHHVAADVAYARQVAISHAAYRVLVNRFSTSPGYAAMAPRYTALMVEYGCDPAFASTVGDSPAAVGNRIGTAVVMFGFGDGSNQLGAYANRIYTPVNEPMIVALPGNAGVFDVRRYQPLALAYFVDQNGQPIPTGFPPFLSAEWGNVTPFAMTSADRVDGTRNDVTWHVYNDPGPPPALNGVGDGLWRRGHEMVAVWSSHLDPADGVTWDISPGNMGNVTAPTSGEYEQYYRYTQGGDIGAGYATNPVTGVPYTPQFVKRGDYARVLAEFWADGPSSETPPGHWFTILNYVMDHPLSNRRMGGVGAVLDPLEYDVKAYLALGGAMHDTAVSVWSVKGWYDCSRPITVLRWLCQQGQCSDPALPHFNLNGIHLIPGQIELITAETTAPGQRHAHLTGHVGEIAIRGWRGAGDLTDPANQVAGVGWILGTLWWPYQRPTFVTPPFGGYASGHSGFSRAAARVLERITGSRYFPGGLGEFVARQNQQLVFEDGPSTDVTLQFASYYDAADQSALSRIWGGIHPPFDDIPSRGIGDRTGPAAFAFAQSLWGHPPCAADLDGNRRVDGADLGEVLSHWGEAGPADIDHDGIIGGADLGLLLAAWGNCP
ncbi:MAG: hypothetical protein DWH86_04360 [Planctomycetota bacterium]|nr:MAG: hypothetical protein DWH86_04360 [Planctomycetota bacterium]